MARAGQVSKRRTVEAEGATSPLASSLLLVARLLVGIIFLIAAVPKIMSPGDFADAVRAFHLLPGSLVLPFAFAVPWIELLTAAYLILGFLTRVGAGLAAALLVMFEVALIDSMATGNTNHACGCFGSHGNAILAFLSGGNSITWWDLTRDGILLVLAIVILIYGAGNISVDHFIARNRD